MAAPIAVARGNPTGFKGENGFASFLTIGNLTTLNVWEKQVGIPGMQGGDPIDTTTMHNEAYRTMAARSLITLTPFQVVCAYDPCVYDALLAVVNIEEVFTSTFFDTSTLAYFAFLQTVEFAQLQDGNQPELTLTIVPTNYDPVHCVEAGPVLTCNGTC